MLNTTSPLYPFVNRLYEADCLVCMADLPDESIDMILCDLPYGMTQNQWDCYIPLDKLWEQYTRIIKPNGVIALTAQGLFTARLIMSQTKLYKYKWIWEKSKPTNFLNAKKQPLRKHEDVCIFYKKQPTYHPQMVMGDPYDKGMRKDQLSGSYGDFQPVHVYSNGERYPTDIIYVKTAECEGEVVHPTQKPVTLGQYLVRTYTDPGDVVLDNAFGSGSFLVSALTEGRNFIGMEKNEDVALFKKGKIDYIEVAKNRLYRAWKTLDEQKKESVAKVNLIKEFERNNPMPATVRQNERSWAISMISDINAKLGTMGLGIVRAGGENTIADNGDRMFPDVLLYGDADQTQILQGWELKLPDTPITDADLIGDAQRKAKSLGLNSCFIWNFTAGVLYIRDEQDEFSIAKQWNETSHIRTREDVARYRDEWLPVIEEILIEIDRYFRTGEIRAADLGVLLSDSILSRIVQRNKQAAAGMLRSSSAVDARIGAFLSLWWNGVRTEYAADETDMYNAYAKTVLLNWSNKILFAHFIKRRYPAAAAVETLDADTSPDEANQLFDRITVACDFFSIFSRMEHNELLPASAWQDLMELNAFLTENGVRQISQQGLQNVLERTVAGMKRELNGQFTTPEVLADLLVRLTVLDWTGNALDPCCGTGTIAKALLHRKKELLGNVRQAVETVWASDKFSFPLQMANISMTDADMMNLPCRVFQQNVFTLTPGSEMTVTDPVDGSRLALRLPQFKTIVSNLPFVPFENISEADDQYISAIKEMLREQTGMTLDSRSDYYSYIVFALYKLLEDDGRLGIITSNSWLGTGAGAKFFNALMCFFRVEQLHISGVGRWFQNAKIVTVMTILSKRPNIREAQREERISFFTWHKSLEELAGDEEAQQSLVNNALLERDGSEQIMSRRVYTREILTSLIEQGRLSLSALFHDVGWLLEIQDRLVPLSGVFHVIRGERRGWDAMFYPAEGHGIEPYYIKRVLHSSRAITTLRAEADRDAFCCSESIERLQALDHRGALAWIERFEHGVNKVGKPLPVALARGGLYWYEMTDTNTADIVTTMNPDRRLFFARFDEPTFINQRLIGLRMSSGHDDLPLYHALLNSVLGMFFVEATGFGRGLGALDINSTTMQNMLMLDPDRLTPEHRDTILTAFGPLTRREIGSTEQELAEEDRRTFDLAVLSAYGIERYYDRIKDALLSMQRMRLQAKQ